MGIEEPAVAVVELEVGGGPLVVERDVERGDEVGAAVGIFRFEVEEAFS